MTEQGVPCAPTGLGQGARRGTALRRFLPLAVLGGVAALAFGLGLDDYLSFEALREHRALLLEFFAGRIVLALALFVAVYAAATAVSLPGGAVLSIIGGFLFGTALGAAAIVLAATVGATAVFLIARTALGDSLRARAGPALRRMEAGFQENALSYLLVLRLIPLFPFFVVNLVPAFLGVRLGTYVLGTFVGIIPGAFVFAFAGAGLGSVLDTAQSLTPASVLTPQVIAALGGLSILALLPVVYKKLRAQRS
jgi:uncharacterized membrane protein YdjX (TVP38/TMEM64 family)